MAVQQPDAGSKSINSPMSITVGGANTVAPPAANGELGELLPQPYQLKSRPVTVSFAKALAPFGIRVNSADPG